MSEATRPVPYPADTRARGWRFELDYEQIEQSDTWDMAAEIPMAQHALLMMWLVAWRQEPCGSFPNDEGVIRAKCRLPIKVWAQCREVLMRGWWVAEDGRLYHDTIAACVFAMLEKREKDASRKNLYDKKFKAIRERDGGACVYCGAKTYLSLDHLIAVSRGGTGDEKNLVTACRRCNSVKGARTPDEAGMTFVNEQARALWYAIRSEFVAFGNVSVTRDERGKDDTKHQAPSTYIKTERAGRKRPADPPCPNDVSSQVWADWCALRRRKRANVDETTIAAARVEAGKVGLSLDEFLTLWCLRGSQGLDASWLKPAEIQRVRGAETVYQQSQRERVAEFAPGVARRAPGVPETLDVEAGNVIAIAGR